MIVCAVYFVAWTCAIIAACREGSRLAGPQADALRRALRAHEQDMDDLTTAADLPPGEFEQAFRQWQARQ